MITLYDADRCPYCARARIVLAEKGVEYETVVIDLDNRPAWLHEKNPLGRVPVLEEGEFVLPESAVIMEYLEERYPDPALLPADPAARALVRLAIERFDNALGEAYYAFRREVDGAADRLGSCLTALDYRLDDWAESYTLAEIAYLPWLLRLRDLYAFDLGAYPGIAARLDLLAQRPAVAQEIRVVAALAA